MLGCEADIRKGRHAPIHYKTLKQVLARGLQLSFTPWSECGTDCGAGYNDRSAICGDADALLVDVLACSTHSGMGTATHAHAPVDKHQAILHCVCCI